MYFHREDMKGVHYEWTDEQRNVDMLFLRAPSRRRFNRFSGPQVLFIINHYGATSPCFSLQLAIIIEWEITHHLPEDIQSERSVINWIAAWMSSEQAA